MQTNSSKTGNQKTDKGYNIDMYEHSLQVFLENNDISQQILFFLKKNS